MKDDEPRSLAASPRGSRLHQGRLVDTTVVESPVESQRAKARVPQLADLARVFHDRDDARTQPAHAGAEWQRRRERRRVGREVPRRLIEPATEIRRYVGLADEGEDISCVHATEGPDRAAALVLDQPAKDHVRARRHVAFEPVATPAARDVRTVL